MLACSTGYGMPFIARCLTPATAILLLSPCLSSSSLSEQMNTITPTVMMTRAGSKPNSPCSATVLLRNADGSAVTGASVSVKWGSAAPVVLTSTTGRYSSMSAPSAARTCTFQVVSVNVAGAW